MTEPTQNNQALAEKKEPSKTIGLRDEIVEVLATSAQYGRESLAERGMRQLDQLHEDAVKKSKNHDSETSKETFSLLDSDPVFQLTTLYEFSNGNLLINGFGPAYRALALDLSIQFQKEYHCATQSERATAHLAAQNYIRTLELQKDLSRILNASSYTDMQMRRYQIISKAYDQANRQYLLTIQTLQSMKQPPININIKTQTANVANQQLIKQDNYEA